MRVLSLRPLGPEPAATYWQRRAGFLALVLLVILLLRWLLSGLGGSDTVSSATGSQTGSPVVAGATATPTQTSTPTPAATVGPCAPAALLVTARAEQDNYSVGGRPEIELSVTNTGTDPCQRDLGQAAVELLVFSGTDRIWSSDDCAPGGPSKATTLEPGTAVTTRVTWSGDRSLPDCEGPQTQAAPGTYRVTARVGDLRVDGRTFNITA